LVKKLLRIFFSAWCTLAAAHVVQAQTVTTVTLYVNAQHPQASDSNLGTEALPFKTISKATAVALNNNKQHKGTNILIAPGTYRESINIPPDWQETDAPFTFEAIEKGKVVVSGSDVWTGWERQGSSSIYTHAWPYTWGEAPYPPYWEGNVVLQPIVRRREMIFVNGALLDQVLSAAAMKPGSFYVNETEGKVYIQSPAGVGMDTATVEVAVRSGILQVVTKQNVTIRGLVFTHDNTPMQGSAAKIDSCTNVLLEDNRFLWNNWGGLAILNGQGTTLRRNVASYNGVVGMEAWKTKQLVAEENETSYNNWRGVKGEFIGWTAAGMKILHLHNGVFRRHRSVGNQTGGLWFDTDCTDVLVEEAFLSENLTNGVFLEAVQGPLTIKDSTICHNEKVAGVFIANSRNVLLEKNIIYGNRDAQVLLSGEYEGTRGVKNWETGETLQLKSERWTLKNNTIVGLDSGPFVLKTTLSPASWEHFVATLTSDSNLWFNANRSDVFQVAGAILLDLKAWRSTTSRDLGSIFADPQFVDPAKHDFRLLPSSPLQNMAGWAMAPSVPGLLQIE
jgi:parallel beta-helix repeat protein